MSALDTDTTVLLTATLLTLNDLERRNDRVVCVISPNLVALGPYYVKVVKDMQIYSESEMIVRRI